jgi:hypothetical protein
MTRFSRWLSWTAPHQRDQADRPGSGCVLHHPHSLPIARPSPPSSDTANRSCRTPGWRTSPEATASASPPPAAGPGASTAPAGWAGFGLDYTFHMRSDSTSTMPLGPSRGRLRRPGPRNCRGPGRELHHPQGQQDDGGPVGRNCPRCSGTATSTMDDRQKVDIGSTAHMAGTHHILFQGNYGFNWDSEKTHGNAIFHRLPPICACRRDFGTFRPTTCPSAVPERSSTVLAQFPGNVLSAPGQMTR